MNANSRNTQFQTAGARPLAYDDAPYLCTRIAPALYHIIPLSDSLEESMLRNLARYQQQCNQLPACLVLGARHCVYFDSNGAETPTDEIPRGGIVVCEKLKPCTPLENTPWWDVKMNRLRAFVKGQGNARNTGYLLGDLTKGGRPATSEELRLFQGTNPDGIPTGLSQCSVCTEWKGRCLDPSPTFQGQLMAVSCRCENDNCCARCHKPLAERKLNANYYSGSDASIWHVPGFTAFAHRCRKKWFGIEMNEGSCFGRIIGEWEE